MEIKDCYWLPDLITMNDFGGDWQDYDNFLYEVFRGDFIKNNVFFRGKIVRVRHSPEINDKIQGYFHVTSENSSKSNDPNDRIPDLRRCERISWIRKLIENHGCKKGCCSLPKTWVEDYKGKDRWHILLENYKFLVVLEERERYFLLITSFYLESDSQIRKKLEKYNQYKQKTPIS